MILYHVTTSQNAALIRRDGFRDRTKQLGVDGRTAKPFFVKGVWFSDRPWCEGGSCGVDELEPGLEALTIDVAEERVREFGIAAEGSPYREWCIPAELASAHLVRRAAP